MCIEYSLHVFLVTSQVGLAETDVGMDDAINVQNVYHKLVTC